MPKNTLDELDDLSSKARRLTAEVNANIGRENLTVFEMTEATKTMGQVSNRVWGEDRASQAIVDEANNVRLKSREDAAQLEGTTLEGYLAHHRDMILLTAIEEARQQAEDYIQETQRRWVTKEWEVAKTEFMESLGHRAHRWGNIHSSSEQPRVQNSVELAAYAGQPPPAIAGSSSGALLAVPPPLPQLSSVFRAHADAVNDIISSSHIISPDARDGGVLPAKLFISASESIEQDGMFMTPIDTLSYQTILGLISSMVGEDRRNDYTQPGYYSSICIDPAVADASSVRELHHKLTSGGKRFLEEQVMNIWSQKLDELSTRGEIDFGLRMEGSTIQSRLTKYVLYLYQTGSIPRQCLSRESNRSQRGRSKDLLPLWAYVYHCLRSGNINSAISELSDTVGAHLGGEQAVCTILQALATAPTTDKVNRGIIGTRNDNSEKVDSKKVSESIRQCRAIFERESMKMIHETNLLGVDDKADPYQVLVLNLVGLIDKKGLASPNIPSYGFEDFLWSHLWFMETSSSLDRIAPSLNIFAESQSIFQRRPGMVTEFSGSENEFLELVYAYGGADYFDSDRSTPFKYALLLCCCHRFGDAIQHLWVAEKFFAAAHLCVLCLHYGLILPFVPLLSNPAHPLVQRTLDRSPVIASTVTPVVIIQQFLANEGLASHPYICIDYLISLHSNWFNNVYNKDVQMKEAMKLRSQEVVSSVIENFIMSLSRDNLRAVVGSVEDALGRVVAVRCKGYLDRYLEFRDVNTHINRIALTCVRNRDISKAVDFFMLAGEFKDAAEQICLVLMIHLMDITDDSSGINPKHIAHDTREFWRRKADSFHSFIIKSGAFVDGIEEPLSFLQTLLGLYIFADKIFVDRNPEEAFIVIDSLGLLPCNEHQADIIPRVSTLYRRIIDDVIVLAANCIHSAYGKVKSNVALPLQLNTPSTHRGLVTDREIKLQSIRSRANALIKYTQQVQGYLSRSETTNLVAKLDAALI